MGEKIIVGPIGKGIRTDRTAFNIDPDSFPTLINAYQWRGRLRRKRGTQFLTRLQRELTDVSLGNYTTIIGTNTLSIFVSLGISSSQPNAQIVPGNSDTDLIITFAAPISQTLTDSTGTGVFVVGGAGPITAATINYATGVISITASAVVGPAAATITGGYYPGLPVMGILDLVLITTAFPQTIAFDTTYPYSVPTNGPPTITHDVGFYVNPPTATYTNYIQKAALTPTTWNGLDYQLFNSVNYQGALWVTNGIDMPFTGASIGMQFRLIEDVTIDTDSGPAVADIEVTTHGLVVGDFVYINEVEGITGINFQTGYVTAVIDANNIEVTFPNATLGGAYSSGGIVQFLTNRSNISKDCIRWYDGDPTDSLITGYGWVNFCPPLSQDNFSITDNPPAQYYLVGCRIILPYKDRLLFIGAVIQTSTGSPIYLPDTVVYSQNGTPFYTCSFTSATDDPLLPDAAGFFEILTPNKQTATPSAFFSDSTGYGGFVTAGIQQSINTASPNQDAIIMGFDRLQARFIYTSNDILPFEFYVVNSEYGSSSTFSSVTMDDGVLTRGERGFVITNQTDCARFDLDIIDENFEIRLLDNGAARICSQRDFVNEWIYFTYPSNVEQEGFKFPDQSLQYNYREQSWAIFYESYTCYGQFRKSSGETWETIGFTFPTWGDWNEPWNSGETTVGEPLVVGGNQQGFLITRDESTTNESFSLFITGFTGSTVTCPNHCLRTGEFIIIDECLGTISSQVNGKIFSILVVDESNFILNPTIGSGTYLGQGLIKKMYVPYIQTKQFPASWGDARKTRIGVQQYLLSSTQSAQIQLLIFLSQNGASPYNIGAIVPDSGSMNDGLIYSTVLYTCPESTNLGLIPTSTNMADAANSNLQQLNSTGVPGFASNPQQQIWHRLNTSLIGDTVQVGFTMSEEQMRMLTVGNDFVIISGSTQTYPAVLTTDFPVQVGSNILIQDVEGMIELNDNVYQVIASTSNSVTIDVDATGFTAYTEGGIGAVVYPENQFAEIEVHGFILDVSPSSVLS